MLQHTLERKQSETKLCRRIVVCGVPQNKLYAYEGVPDCKALEYETRLSKQVPQVGKVWVKAG